MFLHQVEIRPGLGLMLLVVFGSLTLFGCSKSTDTHVPGEAEWCGIGQCYDFADRYWSEVRYIKWLSDSLGIAADIQPYWNGRDSVYLPDQLPHTKSPEYYKMIGRSDQFRWGWTDYDPETAYSCHRELYMDCLRGIGYPVEHSLMGP